MDLSGTRRGGQRVESVDGGGRGRAVSLGEVGDSRRGASEGRGHCLQHIQRVSHIDGMQLCTSPTLSCSLLLFSSSCFLSFSSAYFSLILATKFRSLAVVSLLSSRRSCSLCGEAVGEGPYLGIGLCNSGASRSGTLELVSVPVEPWSTIVREEGLIGSSSRTKPRGGTMSRALASEDDAEERE